MHVRTRVLTVSNNISRWVTDGVRCIYASVLLIWTGVTPFFYHLLKFLCVYVYLLFSVIYWIQTPPYLKLLNLEGPNHK